MIISDELINIGCGLFGAVFGGFGSFIATRQKLNDLEAMVTRRFTALENATVKVNECGQCREKWEVKIDAYHDVSLTTASTIKELAASEMKRLNDKLDLTIDLIKRGAVK